MLYINVSSEPDLAKIWAYIAGGSYSQKETVGHWAFIKSRLFAAQNCSENWLRSWRLATLQHNIFVTQHDLNHLHLRIIEELSELAEALEVHLS